MKAKLLVLNHSYLFFGTTIYVGVLWALHFFWYPSWQIMTIAAAQEHFILPTSAATRFFTVVVPLMLLTNIILIITERKTPKLLVTALIALGGVLGSTVVGQAFIIPLNKEVRAGITDPAHFTALMQRWMMLNDIRWVMMTVMWLAMMYYFVAKGRLLAALGGDSK